jgi:hypothetical protein
MQSPLAAVEGIVGATHGRQPYLELTIYCRRASPPWRRQTVEQRTKFDLPIEFKAAKARSIKVPQSELLRADRVIE